MEDNRNEYRNPMKELFKKYGIHRAIRLNILNDLLDEINTYYTDKKIPVDKTITELKEFHEKHLKEQLVGWVNYLTSVRNNMDNSTDRAMGAVDGFEKAIQILKDIGEKK